MTRLVLRRWSSRDADFLSRLDALLAFESGADAGIEAAVSEILAEVRTHGDVAVIDYTRRFDHLRVDTMAELELSPAELAAAHAALPAEQRDALKRAAERIRAYHQRQVAAVSYTHLTLPTILRV